MEKAKLAVLKNIYDIEVREDDVPEVEEDGMVIKVEAACICGSDGHIVTQDHHMESCLGHEFSGRIVKMGSKANESIYCMNGDLKVGDRISVFPWITCNHCHGCRTYGNGVCGACEHGWIYGAPVCEQQKVLNCNPEKGPHFKGGFGEYVYIFPHTYVWKVPDDMPPYVAALLDPVAVAVRAIEQTMTQCGGLQEGLSTNSKVLIVGAGPIGVIAAMLFKHMGVDMVIINDMVQQKLDMAKEIANVDVALNVKDMTSEERIQKIQELTDGGATIVLNCANHVNSSIEAMQMVAVLGTYVEVGNAINFPGTPESTISIPKIVFEKNAKITSVVVNSAKTFDRAFRLLKKHKEIPFEKLLTHKFYSLDDLLPTLKKMRDPDYLKGVCIFEK